MENTTRSSSYYIVHRRKKASFMDRVECDDTETNLEKLRKYYSRKYPLSFESVKWFGR